MHDHRQSELAGQLELRGKDLLLLLFSAHVPIVIQPDLSDRPAFFVRRELSDLFKSAVRILPQLLRVNAHSRKDEWKALRKRERSLTAYHVAPGIKDQSDSLFRHGGEQLVPVFRKGFVVIVGMRVKNHLSAPCRSVDARLRCLLCSISGDFSSVVPPFSPNLRESGLRSCSFSIIMI